jgi:hypothetical protein
VNLDELFSCREQDTFALGDALNDELDKLVAQERVAQKEEVQLRPVLTHLLDELAGHVIDGVETPGLYTHHFRGIASARDRMGCYLRTSRFFTPDRLAELPPISFSLASACVVIGDWPSADEKRTMERLNYALETGCNADGLYTHFMGRDSETAEKKAERSMIRAIERWLGVMEKGKQNETTKMARGFLRFVRFANPTIPDVRITAACGKYHSIFIECPECAEAQTVDRQIITR